MNTTFTSHRTLAAPEFPAGLERKLFQYVLDNTCTAGLVRDRVLDRGTGSSTGSPQHGELASISATGLSLAASVIATERGYVSRQEAAYRCRRTLDTVSGIDRSSDRTLGLLPHYMITGSASQAPRSEYSTLDTTLFLLGAITAGQYFGGAIDDSARRLYETVRYQRLLRRGASSQRPLTFTHGFRNGARRRFLRYGYASYSEGILVPLLALGSTKNFVPEEVWTEGWNDSLGWSDDGHLSFGPCQLFEHWFPTMFFDLRGRVDSKGFDYWNAARAAVALQAGYCERLGFPKGVYGITACDGPKRYRGYRPGHRFPEHVVAPLAAPSTMVFDGESARNMYDWCVREGLNDSRYGLRCSAFLSIPEGTVTGWSSDGVGIDVLSALLQVDAATEGTVHRVLGGSDIIGRCLLRAGFRARSAHHPTSQ